MDAWPKALVPAEGPMRADKVAGAAEGMGSWGTECQGLFDEGYLQPDLLTGLTLFILGNQPRDPAQKQKIPGAGGGVAGGVWVRERFTIHRPLRRDEVFTITGQSVGRHVHKGRRYGTNTSLTLDAEGRLAGSNLSTGLLSYKVEEGLADSLEGQSPDTLEAAGPDWSVAANNPCIEALRALREGDTFGGHEVLMGIGLMEARDTKNPDNPIHSDPELARKAGLSRPIAGGSHVLAFPMEVVLGAVGRHALFHGAAIDVRWKAPVYADMTIVPRVDVRSVSDDLIVFGVEVGIVDGPMAMTANISVPLPREVA